MADDVNAEIAEDLATATAPDSKFWFTKARREAAQQRREAARRRLVEIGPMGIPTLIQVGLEMGKKSEVKPIIVEMCKRHETLGMAALIEMVCSRPVPPSLRDFFADIFGALGPSAEPAAPILLAWLQSKPAQTDYLARIGRDTAARAFWGMGRAAEPHLESLRAILDSEEDHNVKGTLKQAIQMIEDS